MEDKKLHEFSWTAFFLVTGICFFTFSKILYYLDKIPLPVFTRIGTIALLLGVLNSIRTVIIKPEMKTDS